MQHEILKACFGGKNYFAPLKKPKRILDIGCGVGTWCLQMGMLTLPSLVGIKLTPAS